MTHLLLLAVLAAEPSSSYTQASRVKYITNALAAISNIERETLDDAVEFIRAMERSKTFRMSGSRLLPRDRDNPDSFKVRRAKVGGYRDYFDNAQIEPPLGKTDGKRALPRLHR